jgi:TolB-like protein/Flp pilus assembly protein TadD
MTESASGPRVVRFGVFEVDVRLGELRRQGLKIRLQEQPLQVLALLLAQPGQLVTRDELRQRLWPGDTFVDFDHSLNTAINKLREALGDSASRPHFIETLPRRGYRFVYPVEPAAGQPPRRKTAIASIAVLPLANLSGDPAEEYFVDGMTDALITELAQIGLLRVISRTSVMRFKGVTRSLPEVARELNVEAVVEGSVTRSGDRVRISTQVIEAASDRHLWARSYERDVRDVIALQGDLARAIAHEIRRELSPGDGTERGARHVEPEAYDLFLRARFLSFQWATPDNVRRAIHYYEQAIARDPGYATAYAGLAQAQLHLAAALVEGVSPREILSGARATVRKALELDATDAEAHFVLGWISAFHEWDWGAGERAFRRAIELNPSHAGAHMHLGHYSNIAGRHDDALTFLKKARELDPLSAHVLWSLPQGYLHFGDLDRAVDECGKGLDLFADFWPLHTLLGGMFVWRGQIDSAMTSLETGVELSKRHPHALAMLGSAHALAGRRGPALAIAKELSELSRRRYFSPAEIAFVHASLGDLATALTCLEQAYEERSPWMTRLRLLGPALGSLPSHPRFQELVRRMRFPG